MFLVDLVSWWYFRGWGVYFADYKRRLGNTVDFFSMEDMIRTLFKPYRQISTGTSSSMISGAIDKLISRMVGFFARTVILIGGCIVLTLEALFGLVLIMIWPALPMLPIAGIILAVMGVTF